MDPVVFGGADGKGICGEGSSATVYGSCDVLWLTKNKGSRMGFPRAPPLWSLWCLVVRKVLGNIEKLMALNKLAGRYVIEQQGKLEFVMFSKSNSMISVGYTFYGLGFDGNPLEVTIPTTPIILIPMSVI